MLQMINIDQQGKARNEPREQSEDNTVNLNHSSNNLEAKLPRVRSNKSNNKRNNNKQMDSINISTIEYVKTEVDPEYDDTTSPKVVKIYRKKGGRKTDMINKIVSTEKANEADNK